MNQKYLMWGGIFLLAVATAVLFWPSDPFPEIQHPTAMTVYSLDGKTHPAPVTNEKFHGYPVLGKIELIDSVQQHEVLSELKAGVRESDGEVAACFWPRHGVSITENGLTTDFVICFECRQVARFSKGAKVTEPTSQKREPFFDKLLSDGGITLAPKKK